MAGVQTIARNTGVLDRAIAFAQSINGKTAGEAVGLTIDKTVGAIKTMGNTATNMLNLGNPGFGATFRNAVDRNRFRSFLANNQERIDSGDLAISGMNKLDTTKHIGGLGVMDRIGLTFASSSGKGGYDYGRMGMAAGGIAGAGFLAAN